MPRFLLKWSKTDPSDAIILTYHSRWMEQIRRGTFSLEIRKTGPRNMVPYIVYPYLSGSVGAIVARIVVKRSGILDAKEAIAMAKRTLLTPEELHTYIGSALDVFFYEFGGVEMARKQITYEKLSSEYGYYPSSNFIPLSRDGKTTLDRLGEFSSA